jgi:hypothetical protein
MWTIVAFMLFGLLQTEGNEKRSVGLNWVLAATWPMTLFFLRSDLKNWAVSQRLK